MAGAGEEPSPNSHKDGPARQLSVSGGSMLIGIDVAKAELVVAACPSGERWTVANAQHAAASQLRIGDPQTKRRTTTTIHATPKRHT